MYDKAIYGKTTLNFMWVTGILRNLNWDIVDSFTGIYGNI